MTHQVLEEYNSLITTHATNRVTQNCWNNKYRSVWSTYNQKRNKFEVDQSYHALITSRKVKNQLCLQVRCSSHKLASY